MRYPGTDARSCGNRNGRIAFAAAGIGGALLFAPPAWSQNTYTVTTGGDDPAPAACAGAGNAFNCNTLRDAISASNAAGGSNIITFAGSVSTVTLTGNLTTLNTGTSTLSTAPGSTIDFGGNTVAIAQAGTSAISTALVGAATSALTLTGSGTLTLTGANSYSGGTTVTTGALQGDTTSVQGNVADNGGLIFDQTSNGTYAGTLSGNGTLTLEGSADLALTADSSGFTGSTQVTGGNLVVGPDTAPNAKLGGTVTVQNGAMVSGQGTIGGSLNNFSGTVKPGGSVGTLTVGGNYVQASAGTLLTELNPTAASRLAVGGSASLAGTLQLAAAPGQNYVPFTRYRILTSGSSVSGTFDQVTGTMPVLPVTVQYQSKEVDLVLGGFVGATPNETAVATVLNAAFPAATGDFAAVLDSTVMLPAAQMQQTLSSLGGQIYGNLAQVSLEGRRQFLGAMEDRVRQFGGPSSAAIPGIPGRGLIGAWGGGSNAVQVAAIANAVNDPLVDAVNQSIGGMSGGATPGGAIGNLWASGYGQFGDIDNSNRALGSTFSTGGGAIGADLIRNQDTLLGVAVSGGQSNLSLNTNPESGTITFFQFGAYGAQSIGVGFTADAAALYSHDRYEVSRGIALPGAGRVATSKHNGDDMAFDVGISRAYVAGGLQFMPRIGVSYFHIGQSGFSEAGAGSLNLAVNPSGLDALYSRFGLAISEPMTIGDASVIPEFRATWLHNFLNDQNPYTASFIGSGAPSFTQVGPAVGHDTVDLGIGVSFGIAQAALADRMSGYIQYNATLASRETANAVAGGLRLRW